ncbi:hypothetical protein J3U99_03075 [Brucella pituitosa]|uniref:hypothetical protein n=1 Tax=Brucella pituitosa TaxID=571256 RepID=UPI001404A1A4|nr:hypothetical protein [Brucella pituitosa]MCK4203739.1 hypothetical protein [Brucella pituitosa]
MWGCRIIVLNGDKLWLKRSKCCSNLANNGSQTYLGHNIRALAKLGAKAILVSWKSAV